MKMRCFLMTSNPLVRCLIAALLYQIFSMEVMPIRRVPEDIQTVLGSGDGAVVIVDEDAVGPESHQKLAEFQYLCPSFFVIRVGACKPYDDADLRDGVINLEVDSSRLLADLVFAVRHAITSTSQEWGGLRSFDPEVIRGLAPRQRAVLRLLAEGCSSKEVALAMGVTRQTVETYRRSLCSKLGVSGSRLVRTALLVDLLNPLDRTG